MNVLILTPDAVGSTLLQRLITIYMQFHKYDRPVINLHELSNGLTRYHNTHFNQDMLGRKPESRGYHQSLAQIVELLSSVDHYKTSRLAHYHIKRRGDTIEQQVPFYEYLNDNFYIISCRRHNVFEHALSWCLTKVTKKLNVYDSNEKINSFFDLYKSGIDLDPNSLVQTLNAYRDYLKWCDNHFNVANYFYYDEHLPNIEKYVLSLPIFGQQPRLTWSDKFDQDFDTWNQCHYLDSDLGTLALDRPEIFRELTSATVLAKSEAEIRFLIEYETVADPSWPKIESVEQYQSLPDSIKTEVEQMHALSVPPVSSRQLSVHKKDITDLLPVAHQQFLTEHKHTYQTAMVKINNLVDSGVLVSPPPIKKQTLAEKKHMIRNYDHLLAVYNQWILSNPEVGLPLDSSTLDQFADLERARWTPGRSKTALTVEQKPD
jgi:hypothetical protein